MLQGTDGSSLSAPGWGLKGFTPHRKLMHPLARPACVCTATEAVRQMAELSVEPISCQERLLMGPCAASNLLAAAAHMALEVSDLCCPQLPCRPRGCVVTMPACDPLEWTARHGRNSPAEPVPELGGQHAGPQGSAVSHTADRHTCGAPQLPHGYTSADIEFPDWLPHCCCFRLEVFEGFFLVPFS